MEKNVKNLEPIEFIGSLHGIDLSGKSFYLTDEEVRYLIENFPLDVSQGSDNYFKNVSSVEDIAKIFLTLNMIDEAWGIIEEYSNSSIFDYFDVCQCPYFKISMKHPIAIKNLHENGLIDLTSYLFHNIITKVNMPDEEDTFDYDALKEYLDGCDTLEEAYERTYEIYKTANSLPAEIGVLVINDKLREVYKPFRRDCDVTDYVFGDKTFINYTANDIHEFIHDGIINNITDLKYSALDIVDAHENFSPEDKSVLFDDILSMMTKDMTLNFKFFERHLVDSWNIFISILDKAVKYADPKSYSSIDFDYYVRVLVNTMNFIKTPNIALKLIHERNCEKLNNTIDEFCNRYSEIVFANNLVYVDLINNNFAIKEKFECSTPYGNKFVVALPNGSFFTWDGNNHTKVYSADDVVLNLDCDSMPHDDDMDEEACLSIYRLLYNKTNDERFLK